MALSLEQALQLYPTLGTGARASISRGCFTDSTGLEALVYESVAVANTHINDDGLLEAGAEGTPEENVAKFRAAVAKGGQQVEAAFADGVGKVLSRPERMETAIRAVYRLGRAIDESGNLV